MENQLKWMKPIFEGCKCDRTRVLHQREEICFFSSTNRWNLIYKHYVVFFCYYYVLELLRVIHWVSMYSDTYFYTVRPRFRISVNSNSQNTRGSSWDSLSVLDIVLMKLKYLILLLGLPSILKTESRHRVFIISFIHLGSGRLEMKFREIYLLLRKVRRVELVKSHLLRQNKSDFCLSRVSKVLTCKIKHLRHRMKKRNWLFVSHLTLYPSYLYLTFSLRLGTTIPYKWTTFRKIRNPFCL